MDTVDCIADVWFRLGFASADDMALADGWVTIAELYQFADDAVKDLARGCSIFLTCDASIDVAAPTAAYDLPASHVFTESAWLLYSGAPPQLLRLSTVGQLWALDAAWAAAAGSPVRLSLDAGGDGIATLYPAPVADATLAQIMQALPDTLDPDGPTTLPVSPATRDYFSDAMIAGARSKESDSAMPEVAAHLGERMKLYEAVFRALFGPDEVE